MRKNPSQLPGSYRRRVFVGGSYATSEPSTAGPSLAGRKMLDVIRESVVELGAEPVLADEFELEDPDHDIHHDAMYLLHACRTAVFELSEKSGAMMEIERSADYGTQCLVLYHDPAGTGWKVSQMLSSYASHHADRVTLEPYKTAGEARDVVRAWLSKMEAKGHVQR